MFRSINIKVSKPPFPVGGHYLYQFYQTPYAEARMAYRAINKFPIKKTFKLVGIYYDDPDKVKEDSTRYAVGILVNDDDFDKNKELASTMGSVGYQHIQLPQIDSVVTTNFPLRSVLSILVAIQRVYPKLNNFIKKEKLQAHPCTEYYPHGMEEMHFINPLEKNDSFYVPEYHATSVEYIDSKEDWTVIET